jgi:uncharacterized membrane protein YphA (DoxX/SURF4 family)
MIIIFILGRVLFGGYFIYNAYNHFKNVEHLTGFARMKNVPFPKAAVLTTGTLMLAGGLSILLGYKMIIGMWILVLFLIPTTILMHDFWHISDPDMRQTQHINFFKNVALIGALFLLISIVYLLIG